MIITRTPFRMSFVGGGTDLPAFYRRQLGAVVSMALNKYMYIVVNPRFDASIRVSYSRTEIVNRVEEIQHPIVREALKLAGIDQGIEIVSIADIPAGTGLGTSSSFTVGLLNALYAYKGVLQPAEELARQACHIEIDILGQPIGKQDQYIAAYGGLRYIQFNPDETVFTEPIIYARENKEGLLRSLMLFYTGESREASQVLWEQTQGMSAEAKNQRLVKIRDLALELRHHLNNNSPPGILGDFLHQDWELKKGLAGGITNPKIDDYYRRGWEAGAVGGKILGAGGGGFLLLCCPQEHQPRVRQALPDLTCIDFALEPEGSKIIYVV